MNQLDTEKDLLFIIIYDIPDDRRRNRIHRLLHQFGEPVQKSAFEARLTNWEKKRLVNYVQKIIKPEEDRFTIYPLGKKQEDDIINLGKDRPLIIKENFFIV